MTTDERTMDAALNRLIRRGHVEHRVNPETGEDEYRLTEAGRRAAPDYKADE